MKFWLKTMNKLEIFLPMIFYNMKMITLPWITRFQYGKTQLRHPSVRCLNADVIYTRFQWVWFLKDVNAILILLFTKGLLRKIVNSIQITEFQYSCISFNSHSINFKRCSFKKVRYLWPFTAILMSSRRIAIYKDVGKWSYFKSYLYGIFNYFIILYSLKIICKDLRYICWLICWPSSLLNFYI